MSEQEMELVRLSCTLLGGEHVWREHYYGFTCRVCGEVVPEWYFDDVSEIDTEVEDDND